jgi:hypothetical protein
MPRDGERRGGSQHKRATVARELPTLAKICDPTTDVLTTVDIALMNLLCASSLPGAEKLDIPRSLQWLDDAAEKVDLETRRHWYRFIASPSLYNNSPGYFCCNFLLQVLQEDFGVRYNPARVRDPSFQDPKCIEPDFRDSRDLFIHGIIDGPGGTCASMPVLYVAVGRRLGYPLYLVETRGHLFFRWDDPLGRRLGIPERFNIEGTGHGIGSFPDEYYRTWPEPWSAPDKSGGWYLKSLAPKVELAAFLATAAECLVDNNRLDHAIQAYQWACGLSPLDERYRHHLGRLIWKKHENIREMQEVIMLAREARERAASMTSGQPFHGAVAIPTMPGHAHGCRCMHCEQAGRNSQFPRNAYGHPPTCRCNLCRQQNQQPQRNAPWLGMR